MLEAPEDNIKRYFFDTEFVEENRHLFDIQFISIGIVSEDNSEHLYEISSEFNQAAINHQWVLDNVIAKLDPNKQRLANTQIRDRVLSMLAQNQRACFGPKTDLTII